MLAERLGILKSAVSNWRQAGIPYRYNQQLADLAAHHGIPGVSVEKLFAIRESRDAKSASVLSLRRRPRAS